MRKKSFFFAVLSLFLLVPASITWAQSTNLTGTVTLDQDYRQIHFKTPEGTVKVYLPGDLGNSGPGSITLSGTVMTEPSGTTEKDRSRNGKELGKYVLQLGGKTMTPAAGKSFFNFPVPAGSRAPLRLILSGPNKLSTELLLGQPTLSLAPSTAAVDPGSPALFTDQSIFLNNGNIPVYTRNNTALLFQPGDKFFIRDAAGTRTEAVMLAQSPTQTILELPPGSSPGPITITRVAGNRTDEVKIRIATISLSSPNTNLKAGQSSSLLVTIDPRISDKDSAEAMQIPVMTVDLRNLSPGVVDMTGGNLQVLRFPTGPNYYSNGNWESGRTITGVTPGTFNISATLYPSSAISNNPALTQNRALRSPAEFNEWVEAVRQFLQDKSQIEPDPAQRNMLQNTGISLPFCNSPEELDLCKMMADELLRSSAIPNISYSPAALVAYRAEAAHLIQQTTAGEDFVHTDIIEGGLVQLNGYSTIAGDPNLENEVRRARIATDNLRDEYSPANLGGLAAALKNLSRNESLWQVVARFSRKGSGTIDRVNDIAAYLDPGKEQLFVLPEYRAAILDRMGARSLSNNRYHITSMTRERKPVGYDISVIPVGKTSLVTLMTNEKNFIAGEKTERTFKIKPITLNFPGPKDAQPGRSAEISWETADDSYIAFTNDNEINFSPQFIHMIDTSYHLSQASLDSIRTVMMKEMGIPLIPDQLPVSNELEKSSGWALERNPPIPLIPGAGPFPENKTILQGWSWMKYDEKNWNGYELPPLTPADLHKFLPMRFEGDRKENIPLPWKDKDHYNWELGLIPVKPADPARSGDMQPRFLEAIKKFTGIDGVKKIFNNPNPGSTYYPYYFALPQGDEPAPFFIILPKATKQVNKNVKANGWPWNDPAHYEWIVFLPPSDPAAENRRPPLLINTGNEMPKDIYFEVTESKYKDFDAEFRDSTGTVCHFFKDAICGELTKPWKHDICQPHEVYEYDPKTKTGKFVPDGKYYLGEGFGRSVCEKGDSFCVEMYLLIGVDHIFEDKNCKREVDIVKIYNFTCQ